MTLYIVATPIGNLKDITLRALEVLKEVDFIICENPFHSLKLLNYYQIKKPLIKYQEHSSLRQIRKISQLLKEGKKLALISDAGTPGIADPGNKLISWLLNNLEGIKIIAIPGPSSLIAGLSISGFPTNQFLFLGFPPKKKRKKFFERIKKAEETVVFYESPYRLLKTLKELEENFSQGEVVIIKELTKIFEKVYRGSLEKVILFLEKEKIQGEYLIIFRK